jgi:long-chain fatty acid transport protein
MTGRSRSALCAALIAAAQTSQATGFFVNQQSVRGLGRVDAGVVAAADDASTIFFNAAGLAYLWCEGAGCPREESSAGVQVIIPRSKLTDSASAAATPGTLGQSLPYAGTGFRDPSDPTPIPNIYYARRLARTDTYVGLGLGAPFGLASKYSKDWFGRYDAIEAMLRTINLSAVAAYAPSRWFSIGGGIDVQYAKTKLVTAIPDPLAPGGPTVATDGRSSTEGSAWTPGFNLGMMVGLDDATRLGLSFRSAMNHRISGDATTSDLTGPLAAANGTVGARAKLKLPAMAGIGLVRHVTDQLSLLAEYDWYGWSSFDEIRVSFDDGRPDVARTARYRDAWAASVGAEWAVSDSMSLRGGIRFDRTPTVDGNRDTTLPDADRLWFGLGGSYRLSKASTIDVALNHVLFRSAAIDVTRVFFQGSPLESAVRIQGKADSRVNTISVNYACSF